MSQPVFYCAGTTESCSYASALLKEQGIRFTKAPDDEITDLLLEVLVFLENHTQILRGGLRYSVLIHFPIFQGTLQYF